MTALMPQIASAWPSTRRRISLKAGAKLKSECSQRHIACEFRLGRRSDRSPRVMVRHHRLLFLMVMAAPTTLLAQSKEEQVEPTAAQLQAMQALTPEDVARGVVVQDDDLETIATLTTEHAYQSNGRFTDRVRSDNMLRAFISKDDGHVRYQFYERVTYNYSWRDFALANFATPGGLRSAPLTQIEHKLVACNFGLCTYQEIVGFDVNEADLRAIAATYVPGSSPFWRVRFKARSSFDWNDRMMPAEAAGLLIAVDTYKRSHPSRP